MKCINRTCHNMVTGKFTKCEKCRKSQRLYMHRVRAKEREEDTAYWASQSKQGLSKWKLSN